MDENPQLIESKNDLYPYHLRIHHLPIIASFLDELTIPECIDRMLPIKGEHKISHGEALKFLIISSFTDPENNGLLLSKLYKTIKEIPSFILFNRDIRMDEFSHDVLAKSLEAVGKYGPSKFFSEIVKHIAPQLSPMLDFDSLHADILTFNVYGEKPTVGEKDPDRPLLHIAHGRPKFIGS
ncbi:MAG: DUF4277 domain-containing protein, partial [Deltaproteobacteria bacterium]|nr:DUF4277 domain-containing protein [Deltaproteobacteria bacterium]